MLRGNPDVAELIEVPGGSGWIASRALARRLWRRYDLALIAQYSDRAHLYGFVAGKRRAGQVPEGWKSWWKRALLDHVVVMNDSQSHSVVEKLRLIEPWVEAAPAVLKAPPPTPLPKDVGDALGTRYAVLQIPTAVAYKQWPTANWAVLVEALIARGLQVVLTGAPSAGDRAAIDAVLALRVPRVGGSAPDTTADTSEPEVLDVAGRLDLNQVTALLKGAALYVGGDTSITHLATACGTPVVALYGPIDPRLFGPWPASASQVVPYVRHALVQHAGSVALLQGDLPCVPCNRAGCEDRNDSLSQCLQTMRPARVIEQVDRLLAGTGADNAAMRDRPPTTRQAEACAR
jgi:heptosyltransferase-3